MQLYTFIFISCLIISLLLYIMIIVARRIRFIWWICLATIITSLTSSIARVIIIVIFQHNGTLPSITIPFINNFINDASSCNQNNSSNNQSNNTISPIGSIKPLKLAWRPLIILSDNCILINICLFLQISRPTRSAAIATSSSVLLLFINDAIFIFFINYAIILLVAVNHLRLHSFRIDLLDIFKVIFI